jgi:hypothetical protein
MNPKIDVDAETGEYYEVTKPPTKADWIFGGFWCFIGVFGLIYAHIEGQFRRIFGGH